MTAAMTLYRKKHVRIDILTQYLSLRSHTILDSLLYLVLFFPLISVVLVFGFDFTIIAWSTSEQTPFAWRVPLFPFKMLIPIMALLLMLQGISDFTRNVVYIMKGVRL
jgi:TRAP-type mannitol/chloroaromatic compound transport system permease small subunit